MSDDELDQKAKDIVALLHGAPGPYLEDEKSFFGRKRVNPSMKDARMETDCGGMLITKSKLTYGEADEIAARVDLAGFPAFVEGLTPSCYWKVEPDGSVWRGCLWWAVYSYLATNKHVEGDPASYNNTLEYLFDQVVRRLVEDGVYVADDRWRYFTRKVG